MKSNFLFKESIKFILEYSVAYLLNITLIFFSIFKLFLNIKKIIMSDNLIIQVKGGFGNIILSWDCFRRFYDKKKNVIICTVDDDNYNVFLENLDSKSCLILLKKNFSFLGMTLYKESIWFKFNVFLFYSFKFFFRNKNILIGPQDLSICNYNHLLDFKQTSFIPFKNHLYMALVNLKKRTRNYDHFFLKRKIAKKIFNEIKQISQNTKFKICSFYIRGDRKSVYSETKNRNGGVSETYRVAIDLLLDKNYVVCLTGCGDLAYLKNKYKNKKNVIFDDFSRIPKNLVNLYFLTEVDFIIANTGGALFAGISKNIPILVVNSFPLNVGLLNCIHFYKKILDKNGVELNIRNISKRNLESMYSSQSFTVLNNSKEEIFNAVKDFEKNYSNPNYGLDPKKMGLLVNDKNSFFYKSKISPVKNIKNC